jgi:2-polyprenyl-3-methyl-5-hydroxy-6-metoxy-1,4-benzoquinol methylase
MLKLARRQIQSPQNVIVLHSTLDNHLPGRIYDVILCIGLLAHVDDWKMAVEQIEKMTLPGTKIAFQISDSSRFLTRWVLNPRGKRTHKLNQITFNELVYVCGQSKFKLLQTKRFGFSLPGMGYLPNKILLYYTLMTQRSALFSRLNTEVIALFEKL